MPDETQAAIDLIRPKIGRPEQIESPAERRTFHPGRFIGSAVGSVVKDIGRRIMSRAIIGTSVAVLIFGLAMRLS